MNSRSWAAAAWRSRTVASVSLVSGSGPVAAKSSATSSKLTSK
jgi:hypothetical protein